jgi:uronate dehydrogenase
LTILNEVELGPLSAGMSVRGTAISGREQTMKKILITGAAGGIATMIRPILRADYRLRLSDRVDVPDPTADEEVAPADLSDIAALRRAIAGVDGIAHFGGRSGEAPWEVIHEANIAGCYNLFEAARLEGVRRIVFASSNHAVGFYRRDRRIGTDVLVRPDSRYGVSKVFGEALASLYADKYGAEALSIRIGNVSPRPREVRRLSIWISPRDLCQLIRIGLETPGLRHEVVYGASDNARGWWDNDTAFRLGYRPEDGSEVFAEEVLAVDSGVTGDPRIDDNQGGDFCVIEA